MHKTFLDRAAVFPLAQALFSFLLNMVKFSAPYKNNQMKINSCNNIFKNTRAAS
jgi:hypothetical protein